MAARKRPRSVKAGADARTPGQYAYDGLDRVLHEKARLGIMTSLYAHPRGLLFNDLKELCSLTDGNLSRHLQILNEAGFIEIWKGFHKRRPQTLCRLTSHGRARFVSYVEELERVVHTVESASGRRASEKSGAERLISEGWFPA